MGRTLSREEGSGEGLEGVEGLMGRKWSDLCRYCGMGRVGFDLKKTKGMG